MKVLVRLLLFTPSSLSHCFTPPPTLFSHLCFLFLFLFCLGRLLVYSCGITELKPNSSLAWTQKGTAVLPQTLADACMLPTVSSSLYSFHLYMNMSDTPPSFLHSDACHYTMIPRSILEWFVRYFPDRRLFCHINCQKHETFIRLKFSPRSPTIVLLLLFFFSLLVCCLLQSGTTSSVCP